MCSTGLQNIINMRRKYHWEQTVQSMHHTLVGGIYLIGYDLHNTATYFPHGCNNEAPQTWDSECPRNRVQEVQDHIDFGMGEGG